MQCFHYSFAVSSCEILYTVMLKNFNKMFMKKKNEKLKQSNAMKLDQVEYVRLENRNTARVIKILLQ